MVRSGNSPLKVSRSKPRAFAWDGSFSSYTSITKGMVVVFVRLLYLKSISVEDLSTVPFWSRPRCLSDDCDLDFQKPLFDLDAQTSLYSPKMIDHYSKKTPVYPHPQSYPQKVSVLP